MSQGAACSACIPANLATDEWMEQTDMSEEGQQQEAGVVMLKAAIRAQIDDTRRAFSSTVMACLLSAAAGAAPWYPEPLLSIVGLTILFQPFGVRENYLSLKRHGMPLREFLDRPR